jgi:hypothetical protein
MWRARAARPGLWLGVVFAIFAGFLLGNWQAFKSRAADLSPSEKVALRFPETDPDQPVAASAVAAAPMVMGKALALFSPEPMFPESRLLPAQAQLIAVTASLPAGEDAPVHSAAPVRPVPVAVALAPKREGRSAAAGTARSAQRAEAETAPRRGSRPGFLLNDAQIASIKSRLHLTPDQEEMWPAVEAALRNIAYAKAQVARRQSDDRGTDVASLDPDSAAVQGLKSAAVPLIMSFSDEQKSEVRNLAHVMGLDKLAAEF